MEALYLLVPLSIGIVFVAIRVFFWMSDSGQFDDMVGPGLRVLEDRDDTTALAPSASTQAPGSTQASASTKTPASTQAAASTKAPVSTQARS